MSGTYLVYLCGSENPVWTYKTWAWLSKRLDQLAKHTSLSGCVVSIEDEHGTWDIHVEMVRNSKGWEWWTHGGVGIPPRPDSRIVGGYSSRKLKTNRLHYI